MDCLFSKSKGEFILFNQTEKFSTTDVWIMSDILRNYKTFSPNQWILVFRKTFYSKDFYINLFLFNNTYAFSYPLISWVKRTLKIKQKLTQRATFHFS